MLDLFLSFVFIAVSVLLGIYSYRQWRTHEQIWFLFCTATAELAAVCFWFSWLVGFVMLVPAVIMFIVAVNMKS
jgi:hypothetical protein